MTDMSIIDITGENWSEFLQSDFALLILGKTDCQACKRWAEDLSDALAGGRFNGLKVGKMMLNTGGLGPFKRSQDWLADEVKDLPYNTLWKNGERVKSWPGGGIERLETRFERIRT